jgi:hypothetical protein
MATNQQLLHERRLQFAHCICNFCDADKNQRDSIAKLPVSRNRKKTCPCAGWSDEVAWSNNECYQSNLELYERKTLNVSGISIHCQTSRNNVSFPRSSKVKQLVI